MTTLTEWRAPFQVNTGNASIGHQFAPKVIGLANGWFMVAWREQFGEGAPDNGQDIVAKIYNADGNVEFDSFALNFEWTEDDQTSFDIAPTHDGFVVVYSDESGAEETLRIERNFEDFSYRYGTLTNEGDYDRPQVVANLLPGNDDIFVVYGNDDDDQVDALVIDEDDSFLPTFAVQNPTASAVRPFVEDAVVLSNGNFATLFWSGDANLVSIATEGGRIINQTLVAGSFNAARDIASLADGGYVVVGKEGSHYGEILGQIYDNAGNAVAEIIPIEMSGYVVNEPRVAALPDGGFVIMFEVGYGRYHAQIFNADGSSATAPVLIGDGGFLATQPEISVTADGRIVFVWHGEQGSGSSREIYSTIWDPRGEVIDPDDYGQLRTNFLATDTITTGINGSTVLEGEIGDTILGQGGNDIIYTSGSGDFWGGGGNDLIISSADFALAGDFKYLDGEAGIDTLDTTAFNGDYTVNLETGQTDYLGAPNEAREGFYNFENIISGNGNDALSGTAGANRMDGGGGDDLIMGLGGNDFLLGGSGNDTLEGGEGNDRILGVTGNDTLRGELGNDVLNGGDGNDDMIGGNGDDIMYGGAGNDTMDGGDGNDLLIGNDGDDIMDGGLGNDNFRGGTGVDVIDGGVGDDRAFGGDGNDTLRGGQGNDLMDGSAGDDVIEGNDGDDILVGRIGNDTLVGGTGQDQLRGGGGNDVLSGGDDNDRLFGGSNDDTLFGGDGDDFMQGNQQDDHLFGEAGSDRLFGGDGFDFLFGGAANDTLLGGRGNDVLVGGLGSDILVGGAQNDIFQFDSVADSNPIQHDSINGMDGVGVAGGDRIDLSNIDANTLIAGNQAFSFIGEQTDVSGLSFGAGVFWVRSIFDATLLLGSIDDDDTIDLMIRINDTQSVSPGDFVIGDFIV